MRANQSLLARSEDIINNKSNTEFKNDNVDNIALESIIKNKNYKKLSQKLTKIRFFTTKIAVYYSKLTKIINGEWNEWNENYWHYQNCRLLEYINQNYF